MKILICLFICFIGIHSRKCGNDVYMTYATSDLAAITASVVASSLKHTGSTKCRIIMVSNDVSWLMRPFLNMVFDDIVNVDLKTTSNRILHELYGILWVWKQAKYRRVAFLSPSLLVLKNPDDIFKEKPLSAVPDSAWPDTFSTDVFLVQPDLKVFKNLTNKVDKDVVKNAAESSSPEWHITSFYKDWNRISCVYNTHYTIQDTNRDVFNNLKETIKIIRFSGENRPWTVPLNVPSQVPEVEIEGVGHIYIQLFYHEKWWEVFSKYLHKKLQDYLQTYNLSLVVKGGTHLYLGTDEFMVDIGFYMWKRKSFPKMIIKGGKEVSNEYTTWTDLLQGIRGYTETGLDV